MPRKPRFHLADVPVHVVQRGNNRDPIFFNDSDHQTYLTWLKEAAQRYLCDIHAYVLMTNHVHILATPKENESISRMMQYLGRKYVPYINRAYGRSGTLWEGRYRDSLVQDEKYLLTCMRYIELNPVRANMVRTASAYHWSSYTCNASGRKNELITPHRIYVALGKDELSRRFAYREIFDHYMEEETITEIRSAWQTGTPLGNERFKQKVEKTLKKKVGFSQRGRPKLE